MLGHGVPNLKETAQQTAHEDTARKQQFEKHQGQMGKSDLLIVWPRESGITGRPPTGTKELAHTFSLPYLLAINTVPPAGTSIASTLTT